MFETDRFIEDCRAALNEGDSRGAIRDLVARAVSTPSHILRALGEPVRSGVNTIYRAPDLTILNLCWGPGMSIHPHDHRMWAVIGVYTGREDNIFWRRLRDADGNRIEAAAAAKSIGERDAEPLGRDIIHSVTNPVNRLTAAIHVYGGDFFATPRSEWNPETLEEHPYDVEHTKRVFEEANQRLARAAD